MATVKPNPNQALIEKYAALGLSNAASYFKNNENKANEANASKAVIREVYKLDPANYTNKQGVVDLAAASSKYQFNQPKIQAPSERPNNFSQAITNYSNALSSIRNVGVENINDADYATIESLAKNVRNFDSKDLSENAKSLIANSTQAIDAINEIRSQRKVSERQQERIMRVPGGPQRQAERGKAFEEEKKLQRLIDTANQNTPKYIESFSRFGLSDLVSGIPATATSAKSVSAGLEALRGDNIFQTGGL